MNKPVKIHMTLATNMNGSDVTDTVEVDREEWNGMPKVVREQYVLDVYGQFVWDNNHGGWEVEE